MHDDSLQSIPLGALGTGAVEVCSDGRFRNLSLNNNRTMGNRIPIAPHSFLAVRASDGKQHYVRRLQTSAPGDGDPFNLPPNGLNFRGRYPQADCRVIDAGAPVEIAWSAFAPVVPYDYEASVLPLAFFAIQVANPGPNPMDISCLLNWQNTVGFSALVAPESLSAIAPSILVSEAEWERRVSQGQGHDNERRLSASTGQVSSGRTGPVLPGEIKPNALVFGDAHAVDTNADGQYCLATHWSEYYRTSHAVWDPEDPAQSKEFWQQVADRGDFDSSMGNCAVPRSGALCNRFALQPGQSQRIEFVVSWYCPRYAGDGPDEGNFYANRYPDAQSIARAGLKNGAYYFAAISAWQNRLSTSDMPAELVRQLHSSCEVLSTNSIYTRDGDFGLFESLHDPRMNYLRDRWFWSMGLLLFFPRLELEILDRLSQRMVDEETRVLRISEGMEGFTGAEYVGPGAAQVDACVHLVTMSYRNYLFGGNLSFIKRLMPQLRTVMAAILAQDKDFDGFPDLYHEEPGLVCAFASGFNVITAGLWIVALRAYERLARRQKLSEADVYKKAFDRASRSFDHYFWNRELGFYTLYPRPAIEAMPAHAFGGACHIGQLTAIWVANLLGLEDTFRKSRVARTLEAIETYNIEPDRIHMVTFPGMESPPVGPTGGVEDEATETYNLIRYACARLQQDPSAPVFEQIARFDSCAGGPSGAGRHVSRLALWYLIVASPAAQLDLSEKRLNLRPDTGRPGEKKQYTLYTPNGFGSVSIQVGESEHFQCHIEFNMDIPQELSSIVLTIPEGVEEVQCTLELEDGPTPVTSDIEPAYTPGLLLKVVPEGKFSATGFTLDVREIGEDTPQAASKKQWILPWFRR